MMQQPVISSGTNVALELLPRSLSCDGCDCRPILVHGLGTPPTDITEARAALAQMILASGDISVPLAPIAALADLSGPLRPATATDEADLAAGRVPEALGSLLLRLFGVATVDLQTIYGIALCLAALNRSAEAYRLLSLAECSTEPAPTLLALRGYLAFQNGEADVGRKSLARAALAARGVPGNRQILHFTQHVLLVQQFGG